MGQGLALQLGVHWTRSKGLPGGPGPEPTYSFYIDSVDGDDSNPGTEAAPLKSFANIVWDNNISVGVKRGSVFKEQVDTGAFSNIQIRGYGDMLTPLPVFDCSEVTDVVWIQPDAVNYPTLWAASEPITTDDDLFTMYPSIWIDGERLQFSDISTVYNTPGTWYVGDASDLGTYTFQPAINIVGDPNTMTVEYASRWFGVALGDNSFMSYIRTRRNLHNNGSAALGANSEAQNCIFEDGVKHNVYVGRDSRLVDCIMYKHDWPVRDNFSFHVGHALDGSGATNSITRCLAIGDLPKVQWAQDNNMGVSGFMWHTSGTPGEDWQTVQIVQSTAKNCNVGFETNDTTSVSLTGSWSDGCFKGIKLIAGFAYTQDLKVTENDGVRMSRGFELNITDSSLHVGARIYTALGASDGMVYDYSSSGTVTFQNSVFYRDAAPGGNYNYGIRSLNANHGVTILRCVMYDQQFSGSESCFLSSPAPVELISVEGNYFGGSENMDWELDGRTFFSYPAVIADATVGPRFTNNLQDTPSYIDSIDVTGQFATIFGSPAGDMNAGINFYVPATWQPTLTYSEVDAM